MTIDAPCIFTSITTAFCFITTSSVFAIALILWLVMISFLSIIKLSDMTIMIASKFLTRITFNFESKISGQRNLIFVFSVFSWTWKFAWLSFSCRRCYKMMLFCVFLMIMRLRLFIIFTSNIRVLHFRGAFLLILPLSYNSLLFCY